MVPVSTVKKVELLIRESKVFIASKSYCPYCSKAKHTLFVEKKVPESIVKTLELDTMGAEGKDIQDALFELSGQSTVPNIYIEGKHIGGNQELQILKESGELDSLLKGLAESTA